MIYQGKAITVQVRDNDIAHLQFDLQGESVNKLNIQTSQELDEAVAALSVAPVKGLVITSAKTVFIVGADVTEFGGVFAKGPAAVAEHLATNNQTFNRLEDLPFPTVVALNGYALGGGLEVALACDFRLMSPTAKIGLPEVKLGLIPGWGGTVRLPRLAGVDTAIEWIASGKEYGAQEALTARVIDGVVEPDGLLPGALELLARAIAGDMDYQAVRSQKKSPLKHNDMESLLAFESSKIFVKAQAGRNYPAPVKAVEVIQKGAKCTRDEAQKHETEAFVELALTPQANALVGVFLADQFIGKKAKQWQKKADFKLESAGVLGAGIMGGGIAYQTAYRGIPIVMKDIAQEGLDLGLSEAAKLLSKRVERGRMTMAQMAETLTRITPSLSYDRFADLDIVVEAVVENAKVKSSVLRECEAVLANDAILCTNTSTISIDSLAENLKRPENFCGMHFFNPVHAMPLVEVIRGKATSEQTIARTVAYASALGKKPVVVGDCPGFLVNRVLFPYFAGFSMLLRDGADFTQVDSVMEKWGWPMGPAYLLDVVGIDTAVHAQAVLAEGFPDRMNQAYQTASDILFAQKRLGQKNNHGFYDYEPDKKGKLQKVDAPEAKELFAKAFDGNREYSDDEIIARLMVPMATELARCLEEGVVDTPLEADMALLYGLGFPPFRGGIFRWMDTLGMAEVLRMAEPLQSLGALYHPTEGMRRMAADSKKYYEL